MSYKTYATLTSKGQVTLPAELRRRWGLKAGDQLTFDYEGVNRAVLSKRGRRSILASREELPPLSLGRRLTQTDIDGAVTQAMGAQELRVRRGESAPMIGIDTNILLRLFDRTDGPQTRAVERLIADQAHEGCLLNPIVLSEFAWTLDRTYKVGRGIIADHIDRILEAPEFIVPFADQAADAASRFRKGPADFADYFFAAINSTLGCTTTVTFDRDAGKDDQFALLPS